MAVEDETPRQSEGSDSDSETRTNGSKEEKEEVHAIKSKNEPEHTSQPLTSVSAQKEGDRGRQSASDRSGGLKTQPLKLPTNEKGLTHSLHIQPLSHTLEQKETEKTKVSFHSTLPAPTSPSRKESGLSHSSKSDLSSSLSSHHSMSEGRGFALSPIPTGSLTASGSFRPTKIPTPVRDREERSGSSSPSPSTELVELVPSGSLPLPQPLKQVQPAGDSGDKRDSSPPSQSKELVSLDHPENMKTGSRDVSEGRDSPGSEGRSSRGTGDVETKALVSNSSKVETKPQHAEEVESVSLPLPSPQQADRTRVPPQDSVTSSTASHLQPQATSGAITREVPSSFKSAVSSIEIHIPTAEPSLITAQEEEKVYGEQVKSDEVDPIPRHSDQDVGVCQSRVSEEELLLREAGRGLQQELGELQLALKAAGLPGIGGTSNDPSDELGRAGTSSSLDLSLRHHIYDPWIHRENTIATLTDFDQAPLDSGFNHQHPSSGLKPLLGEGEGERFVSDGGSGEGCLEGTIRALAAEELTSITKELLLQQDVSNRHPRSGGEEGREEERGGGESQRGGRGTNTSERTHEKSKERELKDGGRGRGLTSRVQSSSVSGTQEEHTWAKGHSVPSKSSASTKSEKSKGSLAGSKTSLVSIKTGSTTHKGSSQPIQRGGGAGHVTSHVTRLRQPSTRSTSAATRGTGPLSGTRTVHVRELQSVQPVGRGGRRGRGVGRRGERKEGELEAVQDQMETLKQALATEKVRNFFSYHNVSLSTMSLQVT